LSTCKPLAESCGYDPAVFFGPGMIANKISYSRLVIELLQSTLAAIFRPSISAIDSAIFQMRSIGLGALPTASLIAVTAGFVLALVLEIQLSQIGKEEIVPSLLWIILTEQVVPVSAALIFSGRSVSAITAELGSMQVSEEIKALFTMGIDVVPFLLVPRFLGFQIMLPVVTLVGIYASLLGGWLLCGIVLKMGIADFVYYAFDGASFWSVVVALAKSALFAFLIATIAFYKGLNVRHGSREISEATTQSVVGSVIVVTIANAVVTSFQLV
jgi:phospholipid/cholesterol/gamma-HCH transport system permease protein